MSTSERPARAGRWALAILAVLLLGGGLWWAWRWYSRPAPPAINLDGADPEVAALVRGLLDGVRREPRSPGAWGRLGMGLLANKFDEEAAGPLSHAEALDPSDPRWPYLRGVALMKTDADEALACFRRAAVVCQDDKYRAAAQLRLAEALAAAGQGEEAEAHFKEVDGSLAVRAEYGLGVLAAQKGDRDLADSKARLLRCIDSPLTRREAAAQLAAVCRRLGEADEAAGYGKQAARLPADPPWPDPFVGEAQLLLRGKDGRIQLVTTLEQQGQNDRALDQLREIARDYPDAPTLLALGITLGRRGHFAESEAVLRRCLSLEPGLVRAHYYLSLALFGQAEALRQMPGRLAESEKKFEDAAASARRATQLSPQNGEAHFQLGLALWRLGRRADATAAFRRAVETRPNLADAHLWLGRVLAEDGKKEEAERHLRDAVRYADESDARPREALEKLQRGEKP